MQSPDTRNDLAPLQCIQLDPQNIVKAFNIIADATSNHTLIKQADLYLKGCEANPNFILALLDIFEQVSEAKTQWQILVHTKIVVGRIWSSRKRHNEGVRLTEEIKQNFRNRILQVYQKYWQNYHQQIESIIEVVAKEDFPVKYPCLKQLIASILSTLSAMNLDEMLSNPQTLVYLELSRLVCKQTTKGRILVTTANFFGDHLAGFVQSAKLVQEKLNEGLVSIKNSPNGADVERIKAIMEYSIRIDSIILHSLTTLSADMQTLPEVTSLLQLHVHKIGFLIELRTPPLQDLIERNLSTIIYCLTKLQGYYPFAFTHFLRNYLEIIINLLLKAEIKDIKLVDIIIQANIKPLGTIGYYMNGEEFANSMYSRRSKNQSFAEEQTKCHLIYLDVYGGDNPSQFARKILTDLLPKYPRDQEEDGLIFEDSESMPETQSEKSTFDHLLVLEKSLFGRFSEATKALVAQILQHLRQANCEISGDTMRENMLEVLLLLPRTLDETTIDLNGTFELMEVLYNLQDYKSFARIVRYYECYFDSATLNRSFRILTNIISSPGVDHVVVYQCAVCIKKMITTNEEETLPLECISQSTSNLFELLSIYKDNPNHLWNILNLLAQITKALSNEALMLNLPTILQSINGLVDRKDSKGLIVGGVAEMLEGILEMLDEEKIQMAGPQIFEIGIKHLSLNLNWSIANHSEEEDNADSLFRLWLGLMRNIYPAIKGTPIGDQLVALISEYSELLKMHDSIRFLEISEEYILCGLVQLSQEDITSLFHSMVANCKAEDEQKMTLSLFSLYFTYSLTNNICIDSLLTLANKTLKQLMPKISVHNNTERSILLMIICHHLIIFGGERVLNILGAGWDDYKEWFWPIVWSLDYLNQKYATKVVAMGLLSCLPILPDNMLQDEICGEIPLCVILKFLLNHTCEIKQQQAMNSYMNAFRIAMQRDETSSLRFRLRHSPSNRSFPNKIKLHVNIEWAEMNLSSHLRQRIVDLQQRWSITLDGLCSKLDAPTTKKMRDLFNSN